MLTAQAILLSTNFRFLLNYLKWHSSRKLLCSIFSQTRTPHDRELDIPQKVRINKTLMQLQQNFLEKIAFQFIEYVDSVSNFVLKKF